MNFKREYSRTSMANATPKFEALGSVARKVSKLESMLCIGMT